jgi:DNA repair exonuclease SbcCD ATPase subunit
MKNDAIEEQIKAITGLDKELYREIVWFRQEHLKELLDAKPRDRQKSLDELFGLSDYEVAWTNIAQYQRDYETERRVYEKDPDVNALEKLSTDYNRASEDFALLEMELETGAQRLELAKNGLEEAEAQLKRLEDKKLAIDELKRREARLNADVTNTAKTQSTLTQQIGDKKTLIDGMLQRQNSFESQIKIALTKLEQAGLPTNQPLEQLSACLTGFDEKITAMRAEQEATARCIQQDQKRASTLMETGEGKCPICNQPLMGSYKTDLLSSIKQENAEREKIINHIRLEVATLQKSKAVASEAVSSLQTFSTRSAD